MSRFACLPFRRRRCTAISRKFSSLRTRAGGVMKIRIVSGGQTGADRAALDAAMEACVECGGWCPAGRMAEDGVIPDRYPVIELPEGGGYEQRTLRNVLDSDATVILSFGPPPG